MSMWIKTSKQLPMIHVPVLLWCEFDEKCFLGCLYAVYNHKAWFTVQSNCGASDVSDDYIKYWQTLPYPPLITDSISYCPYSGKEIQEFENELKKD